MSSRKRLIAVAGVIVLVAGWYAFRPERLFVNQRVNESFPGDATIVRTSGSDQPMVIVSGRFHGVAHEGKGMAAIYQLPGGKRVLRFTNFETSNGPDVQVYLVAASDATDSGTVKQAGFLPLGPIKGNIGDQNYELPRDADLQKYRSVTIWCRRFGVNFATAPLAPAGAGMNAVGTAGSVAPSVLASGQFHGVAHGGRGLARVYQLPRGKRVLRFTEFETSNGPDVQVYLVAAPDATDSATVKQAGFLSLGAIKGNIGDQNYDLPPDVDLQKYRSVTIWCRRFGVNFATAPLTMQ